MRFRLIRIVVRSSLELDLYQMISFLRTRILFILSFYVSSYHSNEFLDYQHILDSSSFFCPSQGSAPLSVDCTPYRSELYKANDQILKRSTSWIDSSVNFTSNYCKVKKILDVIERQESSTISVSVLGGSMTAGRMAGGFEGAWAYQTELKMREYFSSINSKTSINIINNAEPGTSSQWALHRLSATLIPEATDLVIVDYDVNDCAILEDTDESRDVMIATEELLVRRMLLDENGPAVIFLNVAINHHGNPLKPGCDMINTCYNIGEIRKPVLSYYGVPIISQKMAIWENFSCPPEDDLWPCSRVCSHPLEGAHTLMADIMFAFLTRKSLQNNQFSEDCSESEKKITFRPELQSPFRNDTVELDHSICRHFSTIIDKRNSVQLSEDTVLEKTALSGTFQDSVLVDSENTHNEDIPSMTSRHPCWTYKEDVEGKPGWIIEGDDCIDKSMILRVFFGDYPMLQVVALTTYSQNSGMISLEISPGFSKEAAKNRSYVASSKDTPESDWKLLGVVDGYKTWGAEWKLSISTAFVFIGMEGVAHNQNKRYYSQYVPLTIMKPNSYHDIKVTLVDGNREQWTNFKEDKRVSKEYPQKFKLISMLTC